MTGFDSLFEGLEKIKPKCSKCSDTNINDVFHNIENKKVCHPCFIEELGETLVHTN